MMPDGCEPNHWLTTVAFDPERFAADPEAILGALRDAGIEARHAFKPMHLQPVFADNPVVGGGVAAEHFARGLSLPSGSRTAEEMVQEICDRIIDCGRDAAATA